MALPAAAANGAAKPAPTPAAKPAPAAPVPLERHPKIREASAALCSAREDLEHAAHDFIADYGKGMASDMPPGPAKTPAPAPEGNAIPLG